jgi:class 3 adenylate cyclase/tetratricopeptide (TPR) repeat protein
LVFDMICPKCQFNNPAGAKFCNECGGRLELICPSCTKVNPPESKFCNECGHPLSAPATAPQVPPPIDPVVKLKRYLPRGLAEKILAQRDRIEGERRQVTVLFSDLVGYTPLTEKLGPEEAYVLMDRVFEILIHKVHDFEGTVNEMTGDGVMGLFGAPIALEDAPQRAIRSALAIHWEMARLNEQLQKEGKAIPPLRMRVGINTGPVVVGTLGNDLRVDFTVVGDTVNLASRMEGLAEPGTTYVTAETFKLTEGIFRFEGLGKKEIKGKAEPVEVYRVIAPSSRRTRFDVSAEQGLTPFMGRQRELELLLDVYARAKSGRGQAISIVADAGMGKSRLLYEFRKAIANEEVTFLEGKCLSYSQGVAYHSVIDLLKGNFDIRESDGDPEIRDKVKKNLKLLQIDETTTLPYFLELLSVKDSGIDRIPISPEGKRDQTLQALTRIVLKGAEIQPLILAVEDLHWIDRSSEDVLKELLEHIAGAKVLLIFTYRTEYVHTWGARSFHSQVTLNRLSNRETLAMVSYLLAAESVAENLQDLILEKTEGIPFFIEEFLKSLKDLQVIIRQDMVYALIKDPKDVTIPSTIQDVIMARVDALPEGAKEVLQTGSVIEREFPHELIQKVTKLPEQDLLTRLSALKDAELLYERGVYPNSTYIFKHALTREVVYDSILTRRRKELHAAVAEAMEQTYQPNLAEHLGTLCDHFMAGENYEKGEIYAKLAARKALKAGSFPDAIEHTKKRIVCLEKLPLTDEGQKKMIDARTALALYFLQSNRFLEAKEAMDPIIDLAMKIGYKRRLCQIETIRGTYHAYVEGNLPAAFEAFEEALRMAEEVSDLLTYFLVSFWFGGALVLDCEFEKATHYLQKALDISIAGGNLWGIASMKANFARACYFFPGKITLGFRISAEAVRLAEECGDILSKGLAYTAQGLFYYGRGLFEETEKYLLKGVGFFEKINEEFINLFTHIFLGQLYFEMGDYQKSQKWHVKAERLIKNSKMSSSALDLVSAGLARATVMINPEDIDLESLYAYSRNNRIKVNQSEIFIYIGYILLNVDDAHMPEAEAWIQKAVEEDQKNGMRFSLGKDYALYAEWFKRKGDRSKARENLKRAIEILKECGADGWVGKYEKELDGLK